MKYPEFKNIIETMKEHRYDFEAGFIKGSEYCKSKKKRRKISVIKAY